MKKILSIAFAMIMVLALSVSVFADIDITGEATYPANDNFTIAIPDGVDVSNGSVVTLKVKGTSDNATVRAYLTTEGDNGRVNDVAYVDVLGGAFEATIDMVIDTTGAIQGTEEPTIIMFKGPDYATPLANTTFEYIIIVGADANEEIVVETPADEPAAPVEDAPATTAPSAPAETGVVLAVLPMAAAAAAIAFSKRK